MALIFAGILPYSTESAQLKDSLKEFEGELYCMKPDVIVAITPLSYSEQQNDIIQINIASPLSCEGVQGELSTDIRFATLIKNKIDTYATNSLVTFVAESNVPQNMYAGVAAMTEHLPKTKVVIVNTSSADANTHSAFGEQLHHACLETNKRVAVIAFGHLSQGTNTDALDSLILSSITSTQLKELSKINPEVVEKSTGNIFMPLITLTSALQDFTLEPRILANITGKEARDIIVNLGVR